ncbi:MAG TPA: sigma-54 dependent transcriptional regulator [Polyangiaceae bacterium]|jgi:DNA-binding NtrC family response regulator|nr:sigma-54 dependent transcriptional regulator [Polyangiaceae bacterium]
MSHINNAEAWFAADDDQIDHEPTGVFAKSSVAEGELMDELRALNGDAGVFGAVSDEGIEQVEVSIPRRPPTERPRSMDQVIGRSPGLVDLYRTIDRVAATTCTVLVTGESGTGKELVARAVHDASDRSKAPFIAVNCGAIPEALLESELFGHARGAFTGAHANKLGRIAQATGGTLFLDEIGEMPLALQVKLLRVLQSRDYSPIGDTRVLKADVRIVAATNVDLEEAVRDGRFREDLYYRLNVIHVAVPALRERSGDVPALVHHFLEESCERLGRPQIQEISPAAMRILCDYAWPGNVRELANCVERAVLLCRGDTIEPNDLPPRVCGLANEARGAQATLPDAGLDLRRAVESYENQLIRQALDRCQWNKKRAANLLGLNRTTLVEMLKRKRIQQVA